MRSYRPLADWPSSAIVLLSHANHGCLGCFLHREYFTSCEIYASGGGLLVAPINAPHLLYLVYGTPGFTFCVRLIVLLRVLRYSSKSQISLPQYYT